MAIETKFLIGDEFTIGSKLQVIITPPDLETFDIGLRGNIMAMHPVPVQGLDGLYTFPLDRYNWELVPETGEVDRVILTGYRV